MLSVLLKLVEKQEMEDKHKATKLIGVIESLPRHFSSIIFDLWLKVEYHNNYF